MNNSPLLLVGGFLAAGLVGGLAATVFAPSGSQPNQDDSSEVILPGQDADGSLSELTDQVRVLAQRIEMLENTDSLGTRRPTGEMAMSAFTEEQLQEAVAAVITGSPDQGTMRTMIANTLEDLRTQEEIQKDMEREQRRLDQLQSRVDRVAEKLGLYPDQSTALYDIYADSDEKRNTLRDDMRNGTADFTTIRESMRAIGDEADVALQGLLSPEQYTQYEEENLGGGGGRGGGGGGRGGGFGG